MPSRGSHQGIEHAQAPSSLHAADGRTLGFARRRTLPLMVEVRRQLTRRRTQLTLGFLVVLPFLLVGAFKLGSGGTGRGAPGLVDVATSGAANFTLFTLFVATGFLLVVVFALFAGDTVASEASWSSLRYLLASPVPRAHLLARKLVVALGFSLFALVLLPAVAYLAGGLFFGWGPVRTPLGTTLPTGQALARLGIIVGYLALTLVFVSALAFLLGVWTDVLSPTSAWDGMARGVLWSLAYSLVLLVAAWWHFERKDIVS